VQHGVTFEEAAEVFFDPFYQYGDATPAGVQEQRDFILGYSVAIRLLLVVYSERGDRTRIISARPATRAERKHMSQPEFPTELKLRPRPSATIQLKVPTDTYENLEQIAAARDMSVDALIKLYIGQGLRQDLAQRFADRVLDLTAQVLARHGQSPEQVEAILREIRSGTVS